MSNAQTPPSDIDQLKLRLEAQLEAKVAQQMADLETLKKELEQDRALLATLKEVRQKASGGYGTKSETVKKAIGEIPKPRFTQDDVEEMIKRVNPAMEINRNRIRAVLWDLSDKHHGIKLFSRGNNRQPAVYEKIELVRTKRGSEEDAKQTVDTYGFLPAEAFKLTASALEAIVRAKGGRVWDVAKRLKIDEGSIMALLEPNSKVYVGPRGWLKIRENNLPAG
jgi:hypothetical protein